MTIDTSTMVPMTEANQNFSRVAKLVDEEGLAVILKNNKPRYVVVEFGEYEEIQSARQARRRQIESAADQIIAENMEAFKELSK